MPQQSSSSSLSRGGGLGANNNNSKNVPRTGKVSSTSKPPPIEKLVIPAIVLVIAILAYQFLKGINAEIKRVNVEDELEIRQVFYGNEDGIEQTYVVLCHDDTKNIPVSSVFQEAYKAGTVPAEFRLIDCNHVLPDSGKTIYERFKFNAKERPTIFITGSKIGSEPQQIPIKHLKTGKMFIKVLKNKLEPRAHKIETTQDLRVKCLDKDFCALLLKGTKKAPYYLKDAMNKLLVEFPKVSFAAIDSSVLYVKNLEEYLPELDKDQPRFVIFKKVSGSSDPKGQRLITSILPLETNGVSYGLMSNLIASIITNPTNDKIQRLSVLPTVTLRTKKLLKEEQAKRERKANRNNPNAKSQSSSPTGFQANDGSRDGRRAEREKRRADHAKEHNVKPKTPEEIKEIERQRRLRMEEEAKKWNMAPEDMPPEGDPITDGDSGDSILMDDDDDEDRDATRIQDIDNESDEDDVMDLD